MAQYTEGQKLQGSDGKIYVVVNGVPVLPESVAPQMPADPTFPHQGPKAAADVRKTRADAALTEAQVPYAASNAEADAAKARAEADRARAEAERARIAIDEARMNMEQGKDPEAAVRAAKSLLRIIDGPEGLQSRFDSDLAGVNPLEYLPFGSMRAFDAKAGFVKPAAKKLFRAKGEGSQSDAENRDWENLTPSTWNTDPTNKEILDNLRAEAVATLEEYGQPVPKFDKDEDDPLALKKFSPAGGPAMQQAQGERYSTPDDMAVAAAMQRVYEQGGSVKDMAAVAKQFKFPVDLQRMAEWQEAVDYRDAQGKYAGQRTGFSQVTPPQSGIRSLAGQAWGDFAAGDIGTGLLSAADAGSFGMVDEAAGVINSLGGGDYESERDYANFGKKAAFELNPLASALGTVAGGITGGLGVGAAAQAAGKAVPGASGLASALQGGRGAVAEGAAYGTAYGAGTNNEDRASGAWMGLAGGALGGGLGYGAIKGAGAAIGGVGGNSVRALGQKGVTMTPGQMLKDSGTLGRIVNRTEEAAESVPGLGALIRQRREDSFTDFNRAMFDDALRPIGESVSNVAEEGVEDALAATRRGYSRALDGVNIPPDGPFASDLSAAGARVAPDNPLAPDFQQIVSGEIAPSLRGRTTMTGQDVQDLLRMAQGYNRNYGDMATGVGSNGPKPFARPVADAFEGMEDAVEGLVTRQSPDTMPAYNSAKEAYRNVQVARDAVNAAKGGTQSGNPGIVTPFQLASASARNAKKYGGTHGTTEQPFFDLTRAGQEVLPSTLPNSGTFDRAAAAGVMATPVLGSAVAAQQGWIDPETAAGIALVSALYSKTGGKVATKAATARTPALRQMGDAVKRKARRGGLFGAPLFLPFALESAD